MQLFQIKSKGKLIGHSKLECCDPPMGVAHGRFLPASSYSDIQSTVICSCGKQEHLDLQVFTEAGELIPCIGMGIQDGSKDIGPTEIYVEVLGIPYPEYQNIFPHHVAAYEKLFSSQP